MKIECGGAKASIEIVETMIRKRRLRWLRPRSQDGASP